MKDMDLFCAKAQYENKIRNSILNINSQKDCIKYGVFTKTYKIQYKCSARIPSIGSKIFNKLEGVELITNLKEPVVIIGPVGEEYTISMKTFISNYNFSDNLPITEALLDKNEFAYTNKEISVFSKPTPSRIIWCMKIPINSSFIINTAWNNKLIVNRNGIEHLDGDYVVCSDLNGKPNFDDMWVINGAVFRKTYNTN